MEKEHISALQREILKVVKQNQFITVPDLANRLNKPKTSVYDVIFVNKYNLDKYICKITKLNGKSGRPKIYLTLKEDINWD